MNITQIVVVAAIALVILFFFLFRRPAGNYEQITQEEAKKLMEEPQALILDVRTEAEYEKEHIPGAVCVPNESIRGKEPPQLPDKEQVILVYCRSGSRSKQAAGKLAQLGYRQVKEFGGIQTWAYELEKGGGQ